ncbi:efflux RND transporter periplasmic adaptor subunit, partial [Geomonas sp.]|uniref:efflux RND transporter periplasmic adaptor subunit n=1 Tax=Geomonas sp. TaxID=2651584 RepID=UPI002B4A6201
MNLPRKKLIPILLVIAVVAVSAYSIVSWRERHRPRTSLAISGNIEAHESVVGFKVQGRLVKLLVEEGGVVRAGDRIAELDSNDYRQQVASDQAVVHSREAELALAMAGTRHQEVKAGRQSLLDAKADLDLRRKEYQRNQALYEKDEISAEARDIAATNLKRAEAVYQRAQENLSELEEGTRKEQIAINRANVKAARENLQLSRVRLGYATLAAPISGVVTVRQAELGEVMSPGSPVVTIADLDHVWLRGYVPETDLGKVHWGDEAVVTTDTFPGKRYRGRISFISSEAEFTPKSVETHAERVTLVYRIKIDLENANRELK